MKNIFYVIGLLAAVMVSCDPLDETYKELETLVPDPTQAQVFEITLTDDEYDFLDRDYGIGGYGNFESVEEAKQYIPYVLDNLYPQLGAGSAITVTYNLYRGRAYEVDTYSRADQYVVTEANYNALGGDAALYDLFNKGQKAEAYLPGILADTLEASEGKVVLVRYKYADEVVDPSLNLTMDATQFQTLVDYTENEIGAEWIDSYGTLEYYYGANSYFKNFDGRAYKRKQWIAENNLNDNLFEGSASDEEDSLRIEARMQAGIVKFLEIAYPDAESTVNGQDKFFNISYAVFYGGDAGTVNWNVQYQSDDNGSFSLKLGPTTSDIPSNAIAEDRGIFYEFNGSAWKPVVEGVDYLSSADYDAMGAPGRYDNFSSSVPADDYIPQYLAVNYPYAQEEDKMIVVYKYYSSSAGGVQTRGNVYNFLGGNWIPYESEIIQTLQFSNEEGQWVPDNTIRYTLSAPDYAAVAANAELGNDNARSNLSTYGNFNLNGGYWSAEDIVEAVGFILHENFPSSEVGQKYLVSYDTYPAGPQEVHVILNESGDYEPVK